jgi:hypothetical protein
MVPDLLRSSWDAFGDNLLLLHTTFIHPDRLQQFAPATLASKPQNGDRRQSDPQQSPKGREPGETACQNRDLKAGIKQRRPPFSEAKPPVKPEMNQTTQSPEKPLPQASRSRKLWKTTASAAENAAPLGKARNDQQGLCRAVSRDSGGSETGERAYSAGFSSDFRRGL